MKIQMTSKILATGAAATLLFAVGCGRDLRGFDEVEADFDNPSGEISQATMPGFLANGLGAGSSSNLTSPASSFDSTGTLNLGLAAASQALGGRRDYLVENCATNLKLTRSAAPEKIIVDCTAAGNDPKGKLVMEFAWDNDDLTAIYIRFDNWCEEGGDCIDGWLGFRSQISGAAGSGLSENYLLVAKMKHTSADGSVDTVDYAIRESLNGSEVKFEILVNVNDNGQQESIVFSSHLTASGGSLEIRGSNGTFTCTYTADGNSGECTASGAGGSFSWSVTG